MKELYSKYGMPIPLVRYYAVTSIAVVGFPGEYKHEKWGMVANIPKDNKRDWTFDAKREIFVYKFIDTNPGQSGSTVMGNPSEILECMLQQVLL